MILHKDSNLNIYFGDKKDLCVKSVPYNGDYDPEVFNKILKNLNLKNLVFLKQVHENFGLTLTKNSQINLELNLFKQEGDFIITNLKQVGIGILTADCLPVVIYDPIKKVISVIHSGWRSAAKNIFEKVILEFKNNFNSKPEDLICYFGPCAKPCCYEVDKKFIENFTAHPEYFCYSKNVSRGERSPKIYFDLPNFAQNLLINLGINSKNIITKYNTCTICDQNYYSYRRDKDLSGRQMTVVFLR